MHLELDWELSFYKQEAVCPRDEASDSSIPRPIAFASKILSDTEKNTERETLGILHGLENFIITALQEI